MKRATQEHEKHFVDILSRSFNSNDSVNYVVKQDARRVDRINKLMEYSFYLCRNFGEAWISDDDRACALVLYPDKKRTTFKSIVWDVKLAVSVIGIDKIMRVLKREAKIKSFHPKKPFCYLWFIGVNPAFQNMGIGTLLDEIILKSQADDRSIYLETSVERNLKWYKNRGFEIYGELEFPYKLFFLRKEHGRQRS
jgi:ribosomal protein S18 acetylase RimI-like enzyme